MRWAVVTRTDGAKVALKEPSQAMHVMTNGGTFFMVTHADGEYQLESSNLLEYSEVVTDGDGPVEAVVHDSLSW